MCICIAALITVQTTRLKLMIAYQLLAWQHIQSRYKYIGCLLHPMSMELKQVLHHGQSSMCLQHR